MQKLLMIIFFGTLAQPALYGQTSPEEIIEKSRNYYQQFSSGTVSIQSRFKSSIAESFSKFDFTLIFCKSENVAVQVPLHGGPVGMSSGKKYYLFDNQRGSYQDLSGNKELKNSYLDNLKRYPFYFPDLFRKMVEKKWSLEIGDSSFHLYDNSEHYFFDRGNFAITRYKEITISSYGMQVREWQISTEEYNNACSDSLLDYARSRLSKYQRKGKMGKTTFPKLQGQMIRDSLFTRPLVTVNQESIPELAAANKYLLLDFFYQSCMPCILSFPHLVALQEEFGNSGGLMIIGVDPVLEDSVTMKRFIARYKLNYGIVTGEAAKRLGGLFNRRRIFPSYILVDPGGKIIAMQNGYDEHFFKKVRTLIGKEGAP